MAKYILLDAVLAEIERLFEKAGNSLGEYRNGAEHTLISIKDFLDTLEVKEVDLDKTFNDEYSKFSNDTDAMDYAFPIDLADFKDFAKHFFELGMAVSNKAQKGEWV